MNELWLIFGMAAVTYGIRAILLPGSNRRGFSPFWERALRYVPPAVLTAIIFPAVFIPRGKGLELHLDNPHLAGAAAAALVGWFSGNLLLTIVSGMTGFWLWRWITG
ncbi:MAG: AzlD domain-containing protein [Desulfobacteraceae bacterium]|nr:MAG: AzlD domain-containing protein [Desulfobacteraceae bacterium]